MDYYDKEEVIKIFLFDGQTIWSDRQSLIYEVGNFLGGGAAGTVYECENAKTREHFALKILNPIGYKLMSPALLRRCIVILKGKPVSEAVEKSKESLTTEHLWWLLNESTKQYVTAYYSQRNNSLQEISLLQCCQLWGANPETVTDDENGDARADFLQVSTGLKINLPVVPPKYADFVRRRRRIFTEIRNMRKISNHVNVIRLEQVLELTQESKCTIFLVMELANGGELFDRIKIDCGTREGTAKVFFRQLLLGVRHCHNQGVCHRDLKPENLLLSDAPNQETILKIADFGFSARFVMGNSISDKASRSMSINEGNIDDWKNNMILSTTQNLVSSGANTPRGQRQNVPAGLRVLKSVVGSPFYVAPEVLQAKGYDGQKADVWSLGVILYAMLAGNLPFEQELSTCKRFKLFCKWVIDNSSKNHYFWNDSNLEYPEWLFPAKFSLHAKSLIVAMLHPEPDKRITVAEAMRHALVAVETPTSNSDTVIRVANVDTNTTNLEIRSISRQISSPSPTIIDNTSSPNTNSNPITVCSDDSMMAFSRSNSIAVGPATSTGCRSPVYRHDVIPAGSTVKVATIAEDSNHKVITRCDHVDDDSSRMMIDDDVDDDAMDEETDQFFFENDSIDRFSSQVSSKDQSHRNHIQPDIQSRQLPSSLAASSSYSTAGGAKNERSTSPAEIILAFSPSQDHSSPFSQHIGSFHTLTSGVIFPSNLSSSCSHSHGSSRGQSQNRPCGFLYPPPPAPSISDTPEIDDLIVGDRDFSINLDTARSRTDSRDKARDRGGPSQGEFMNSADDDKAREVGTRASSPLAVKYPSETSSALSSPYKAQLQAKNPPSFNDLVKRSTRFITAVPAFEVLEKVESVLEQYLFDKVDTPIGQICKIDVHRKIYRLEVWGPDTVGPPLCALQLYQLPPAVDLSPSSSLVSTSVGLGLSESYGSRIFNPFQPSSMTFLERDPDGSMFNPILHASQQSAHTTLFLAEFIRGTLEIFAFKRFYQWVRQRLSELVKRDYAFKLFEQAGSPTLDSTLLQRYQQSIHRDRERS